MQTVKPKFIINLATNQGATERQCLDDETASWPIPDALASDFNKIKYTHKVLPLRAYDEEGAFIEPTALEDTLKNSLVEVHFRIKHHRIGNGEYAFDSFVGTVDQVMLLARGPVKSKNPYKRKNARDGPYRPRVNPAIATYAESSASGASRTPTASGVAAPLLTAPTFHSNLASPSLSSDSNGSLFSDASGAARNDGGERTSNVVTAPGTAAAMDGTTSAPASSGTVSDGTAPATASSVSEVTGTRAVVGTRAGAVTTANTNVGKGKGKAKA